MKPRIQHLDYRDKHGLPGHAQCHFCTVDRRKEPCNDKKRAIGARDKEVKICKDCGSHLHAFVGGSCTWCNALTYFSGDYSIRAIMMALVSKDFQVLRLFISALVRALPLSFLVHLFNIWEEYSSALFMTLLVVAGYLMYKRNTDTAGNEWRKGNWKL